MVAGDDVWNSSPAATKRGDELQELSLHNSSVSDGRETAAAPAIDVKRLRSREVASRYKAATISSANAAAITTQRYQSPGRGRSPSPNLGRNTSGLESSAPKRATSAERRPVSVEKRRPWPSSAAENNTPSITIPSSKPLNSKKLLRRAFEGLWPSINTLSSSLQSDTSSSSLNCLAESKLDDHHTLKPTQNGARKASDSAKDLQQDGIPARKGAPERTRRPPTESEQVENSKPFENLSARIEHRMRWPGMSNAKNFMSRSMDLTLDKQASLQVPSRYRTGTKLAAEKFATAPNRNLSRSVNEGPSNLHISPPSPRSIRPTSPSRGFANSTKTRTVQSVSLHGREGNVARPLNLNLDVHKNRKGPSQQDESHDLRLLHNRWLQWRLVNARAELAITAQTTAIESLMYNVCSRICELRMLVATKQAQRNKIREELKLDSVLRSHVAQLEEWEYLHSEHSSALTGFVKALEAALIRLPLIGGPKIDVHTMKGVLSSATDVMNAIDASVNKFLPKAELADCLLSELAKTMVLQKASLEECGELLAAAAILETEECSLRMYLIQLEQFKTRLLESDRPAFTNSIIVR